jgi:hypothetical protein
MGSLSTLKGNAIVPRDLLKGKIYRFSGYFVLAKKFLYPLLFRTSKIFSYIVSHLVAVYCKLGEISEAKRVLYKEYEDLRFGSCFYLAR